MTSIEQVLKNKIYLIEKKRRKFLLNIDYSHHLAYETTKLNIKNSLELLERLTSFFYYLISTYQRKNGKCEVAASADVYFPCIKKYIKLIYFRIDEYEENINPLTIIKRVMKNFNKTGYILSFTKPFELSIWIERKYFYGFGCTEYEEEEEEDEKEEVEEEDEEEEEDKDELQNNTIKSFKSAECVTCLDNLPNILFCNCGHICICNVCLMMMVEEFDACPICKKNNPIKRMIE